MSRGFEEDFAPDFRLRSTDGREIALANYRGVKNVVLVFNRGFM